MARLHLESNSKANPRYRCVVQVHEAKSVRIQSFVECLIDDLQVGRHGEPAGAPLAVSADTLKNSLGHNSSQD